jgi:hypothetical protein
MMQRSRRLKHEMEMPGWVVAIALSIVFVLVPGAIAVWAAVMPLLRARRMRAAEHAPLPAAQCLACGEIDLERVAAGVTRCRACGFAGGEGIARLQHQRRVDALGKLNPGQRRAVALGKLREAQLLLGTAQESLVRAISASMIDIVGLSFDRGDEKQDNFAAALRMMRTALSLASEAAEAVQLSAEMTPPNTLEESSSLLALDTAWLTEGLAADVAMHARIRRTKGQQREMREHVDTLLQQLTAAATSDLNPT